MNAKTLMTKIENQRIEGEKGDLLKGLRALLLVTPTPLGKARTYLENAIAYIEEH